jgi:hypothetical protein
MIKAIDALATLAMQLFAGFLVYDSAQRIDEHLGGIVLGALLFFVFATRYVTTAVDAKKERDELLVTLIINILDSHNLLTDDIRYKFNIKKNVTTHSTGDTHHGTRILRTKQSRATSRPSLPRR